MFNEPSLHGGIINTLFAAFFAVNIVAVVWGIVMYFGEFGSDHGKAEGKAFILKSVTYLFLLMVLYGAVEWVRNAVGF